jgi:hypothetical protein
MKEPTVETVEIMNQSKCPSYMYSIFHPDLSCPEKYAIQHLMACER